MNGVGLFFLSCDFLETFFFFNLLLLIRTIPYNRVPSDWSTSIPGSPNREDRGPED